MEAEGAIDSDGVDAGVVAAARRRAAFGTPAVSCVWKWIGTSTSSCEPLSTTA